MLRDPTLRSRYLHAIPKLTVADICRLERRVPEVPADGVDDGGNVSVGVRVNPDNDVLNGRDNGVGQVGSSGRQQGQAPPGQPVGQDSDGRPKRRLL